MTRSSLFYHTAETISSKDLISEAVEHFLIQQQKLRLVELCTLKGGNNGYICESRSETRKLDSAALYQNAVSIHDRVYTVLEFNDFRDSFIPLLNEVM